MAPEENKIPILSPVMARNNEFAGGNRLIFRSSGVFAVNIISSPGAGKTSLLEAMARKLGDDLVVIETPDAVLVAKKDRAQDIKHIVQRLKAEDREEHRSHRRVHRPWGSFQSLDVGDRFQVKRITLKPGAAISLQLHHHRAEHWIVVSGTALVTRGDERVLVSENESTYIPVGTRHRLENPGKLPLEIIEVQSGSYLGEDDIVRFEDLYHREGDQT